MFTTALALLFLVKPRKKLATILFFVIFRFTAISFLLDFRIRLKNKQYIRDN